MKTISVILVAMLFIFSQIKGQDTNKVSVEKDNHITINADIDIDEIIRQIEETKLKMEEMIIQKKEENEKLNEEIYAYISKPDGENVYEAQIDSLDELIEINKDFIDDMTEAMAGLAEEMAELAEKMADLLLESGDISDETYYNYDYNNTSKKHKSKKFKGHYAGIQLSLNSYVDGRNSLNLPVESDFMTVQTNKSWQFDFNPVQFSIPFFNRYVGAVTGIGFSFNNYELIQNISLSVDLDGNLIYNMGTYSYHKNRFKTASLNAPLIVEFQIPVNKSDKRLFIGAGVIGSLNLSGRMKLSYFDGQTEVEYKDKNSNWPLNMFSYQTTARFGYDQLYLFANYSLVPMFQTNKGPELYPVSAGIGLRF